MANDKGGETTERQPMDGGMKVFFDGTNGPFNLGNMIVGSDGNKANGVDVCANALKLRVSMDRGDGKSTVKIGLKDFMEEIEHN